MSLHETLPSINMYIRYIAHNRKVSILCTEYHYGRYDQSSASFMFVSFGHKKKKNKKTTVVGSASNMQHFQIRLYLYMYRTHFLHDRGGKQAGSLLMPREKHITRVNVSLLRQESSLKVSFGCQRFTKILNFGQIHQIIIGNKLITSATILIMPENKLSHCETSLANISFLSRFIIRFIDACSATIETCLDHYH